MNKFNATFNATFYLSIVAIFKNEKDILTEWLEHHHRQGVEHFYLIDNGSTDDYKTAIAPYRHLVDLVVDPQRYKQPEHYNRHFLKKSKSESEWVMVIDLDEFVYAQKGPKGLFRSITDYLRSLDDTIGQVYIPWKEYGSNGHLQQPPRQSGGCLANFIRRKLYRNETQTHTKTITRTRYLTRMWIHHSFIQTDHAREITSDGRPRQTGDGTGVGVGTSAPVLPYMAPISETILKRSALHCNHYYSRSFEWFRQVKMTRGSASAQSDEKDLCLNRFNQWNLETNQVVDMGFLQIR
jgi:hypothetical protein